MGKSVAKWFILLAVAAWAMPSMEAQTPVRNPHGPLAIACQNCHTTTSWVPIRATPEFDHNTNTKFPLRGLHTSVACNSCHVSRIFTEAGTQCADCHADIHTRQFGAQCESCHTVQGWRVNNQTVRDHWNRFPLLGAHATATCDSCHKSAAVGVYVGLSTQCASCHLRDYQQARSVNHVAAALPTSCETCHSVNQWQSARFDHSRFTRFVLTGVHASLDCATCHTNGRFQDTPATCIGCHAKDYTSAANPNHAAAGFPQDCANCHTTGTWQGATFDHATTGFTLTGAHVNTSCVSCHIAGKFAGTATACSGCHMPAYTATTNPNHQQAGFPLQCEGCHTTTTWQGATLDHNLTKFPLTGAHATVTCAQCHTNKQFASVSTACSSCHTKDFQATTNPNHVSAGFPQDCALCHTTVSWSGANFDHNLSKFRLTGAHASVMCATCHVNGNFTAIETTCISCHTKDWQGTNNPNHAAASFPQDCSVCHSTVNWLNASFNHTTQTKFPLIGAHANVASCTTCHVNNVFAGLSTQCISCHVKDWQGTTNPNHVAAGFPQDCAACHSNVNWLNASFNHTTQTKFPLTGAHASVSSCTQCHVNNVYAGLSTACYSCHQNDYKGASNPNHAALGFPQDCAQCHTTVAWAGATFNHSSTGFPLTGKHASTQCLQCHVNNNYNLTSTACYSCHSSDFNGTNNPPHAAAGFPQDCSLCHTTVDWSGATFNHATTGFALTGKHTTTTCTQCHVNNNYNLSSGACYSCHANEYKATNNPPHASAGFPQDCSLCHSTTDWLSATFNHTSTGFTLVGKHATVTCSQCHINNNYNLTSTACYSCHSAEYNSTTNPNHVAAQFPKTCDTCHGFTSWAGATFNHTWFPMTHGRANSVCSTCHTNSNDYAVFQCTNCHTAAQTNNQHSGVRNYVYNSVNCYACHPRGNGG